MAAKLHPDTKLGHVHLTVSYLPRAIGFYQRSLGFQLHRQQGDTAWLGAGGADLLILTEQAGARHVPRTTGLYHFAILTPSRLELAKVLRNFIHTETQLSGWSDHLVSEAIYLSDPDGNGIEIYRDRPRANWPRFDDGSLKMASDPLDYQGILGELDSAAGGSDPWEGLHPDTMLGHMHLHVADIAATIEFYRDVIGWDFIMNFGGQAAFFSAGGYHHHLGANTWNGRGAPPPPPGAVGLRHYTVQLVSPAERDALIARLDAASHPFEERPDGLFVRDPAQNGMLFK
jgi:catechol 2,3-dioxygenase